MAKKTKYGKVEVPSDDFKNENIMAHISIRLPLNLLKELKRLALTEEYEGRYQILIRDILQAHISVAKSSKKKKVLA